MTKSFPVKLKRGRLLGLGVRARAGSGGRTRLISRNRFRSKAMPLPMRLVWDLVIDPGSLVMERKMLRGIRQRAERLAAQSGTASV